MSEAALKAKREYQKRWRRRNREKTKIYQQTYWEKKAKELENER